VRYFSYQSYDSNFNPMAAMVSALASSWLESSFPASSSFFFSTSDHYMTAQVPGAEGDLVMTRNEAPVWQALSDDGLLVGCGSTIARSGRTTGPTPSPRLCATPPRTVSAPPHQHTHDIVQCSDNTIVITDAVATA
jgi:hypothetical protein